MERGEIALLVRTQVAAVVGAPVEAIEESTDLRADYAVDSLELMEIGSRLENAVGVRVAPTDLLDLQNVGHAIDLLHRHLGDGR